MKLSHTSYLEKLYKYYLFCCDVYIIKDPLSVTYILNMYIKLVRQSMHSHEHACWFVLETGKTKKFKIKVSYFYF